MSALLKETKEIFICVPGDSADYELHTDAADRTKVASYKKTPKRKCLQSDVPSSGDSSSSSSYRSRLRSSQNTPTKDDVGVKPTFPPPIDLTINQDKRAVKAVSYARLRKKKYFVDKSDLIREIYMVSFKGTKIMDLAKDDKGNVQDGAIGFNHHIVIHADFGSVEVENVTLEEIKTEVTEAFCDFVRRQYSMSSEAMTVIESLKANNPKFVDEIVSRVKAVLPQTTPDSVELSILLIIDNFDAPALRILNKTKSTQLALNYPPAHWNEHEIEFEENSNRKLESYPYGREEICSKFFFSVEDVKTILKNSGEDENKVDDLSKICGQYHIRGKDYFHPGCIVNYVNRPKEEDDCVENSVYWSSLDPLDILADLSSMLRYEMVLWTYGENQILNFNYRRVLIYENLMRSDADTANTYLLEAGYLTRIKDSTVNREALNLFAICYKEWCERIPTGPNYEPMRCFGTGDYKGFFEIANNILKISYAGEDFQYEGQYHVYLSSFFHNIPEWHFKSNYQASYGRYDFVAWSKSPLVNTGYLFEIAILKPDNDPKKRIAAKILEKKQQVEDREYFLEVQKDKVKCIIVVGCRKMLSYAIFDVKKPK